MIERKLAPKTAGRHDTGRPFLLWAWHGSMALFGFVFGLLAEQRPFGDGILLHPLVIFFALAGLALLLLSAVVVT